MNFAPAGLGSCKAACDVALKRTQGCWAHAGSCLPGVSGGCACLGWPVVSPFGIRRSAVCPACFRRCTVLTPACCMSSIRVVLPRSAAQPPARQSQLIPTTQQTLLHLYVKATSVAAPCRRLVGASRLVLVLHPADAASTCQTSAFRAVVVRAVSSRTLRMCVQQHLLLAPVCTSVP